MAMNPDQAEEEAIATIVAVLLSRYKEADPADLRAGAEMLAIAARVAVAHVRDRAEIDPQGGGLI
jgi:hypothetical protein